MCLEQLVLNRNERRAAKHTECIQREVNGRGEKERALADKALWFVIYIKYEVQNFILIANSFLFLSSDFVTVIRVNMATLKECKELKQKPYV